VSSDQDERALRDPAQWDWESGETLPRPDKPGAVLAVRFTLAELTQLSEAADQAGQSLTQFVHDTVLASTASRRPAQRRAR
jgi:hypothetical protein